MFPKAMLLGLMASVYLICQPGSAVAFVTPVAGEAQIAAATAAGFATTDSLHSVRIEGPDEAGIGAKLTAALAGAGINLRGLSAAALGGHMVCYLALDTAADAAKAVDIITGL